MPTPTEDLTAAIEAALAPTLTRMTEAVNGLTGLALNNVLRAETVTIGAAGRANRNFTAPYASIGLWAYNHDLIASSGPDQPDAPQAGIGVIYVPAGGSGVFPLVGSHIQLWGTAGDRVFLAAWSTPQNPSFGDGPVIGGTP